MVGKWSCSGSISFHTARLRCVARARRASTSSSSTGCIVPTAREGVEKVYVISTHASRELAEDARLPKLFAHRGSQDILWNRFPPDYLARTFGQTTL